MKISPKIFKFVPLLLILLLSSHCGGGGGGGGTSSGSTTQSPTDVLMSFSKALKSNDNTTAIMLFNESNKTKNISKWESLAQEERSFLGEAIEASFSAQKLTDNKARIEFDVVFIDESGRIIKGPIILVMEKGTWKILDY